MKVYTFATRQVPAVLKEALDNAGLTADDVDHLLLHQGCAHRGDSTCEEAIALVPATAVIWHLLASGIVLVLDLLRVVAGSHGTGVGALAGH